MVWLEQPAGVGFSYSDNPNDYNTNDTRAAEDNYKFLQGFFKLFPNLANNDVWFTGESYAGNYIPSVTNLVLQNNNSQLYKQLKGFMAGNPVMFCESLTSDANTFNLLYYHGFVSYSNLVQTGSLQNKTNFFLCNVFRLTGLTTDATKTKRKLNAKTSSRRLKLKSDKLFKNWPLLSLNLLWIQIVSTKTFVQETGLWSFQKLFPALQSANPLVRWLLDI